MWAILGLVVVIFLVVILISYWYKNVHQAQPQDSSVGVTSQAQNMPPVTQPTPASAVVVNVAALPDQPASQVASQPASSSASSTASQTPASQPTIQITTASQPVSQPAVSHPPTYPSVSVLTFIKDTTHLASMPSNIDDNIDWRTFQIGEVQVYDDNGTLLTAADYDKAFYNADALADWSQSYPALNAVDGNFNKIIHTTGSYGPTVESLTLVLKTPKKVSKVAIYNRLDCCQQRLAGVVMTLIDPNGDKVKQITLTADMVQQVVLQPV